MRNATRRRFGLGWLALLAFVLSGIAGALLVEPAVVPAQQTITPGHIVVEGSIKYISRDSERSYPAAGVLVEVWDLDKRSASQGDLLFTTMTDVNGFFKTGEISNKDTDGPTNQPDGGQDIFLKLKSDNGTVRLLKAGTRQMYEWNSYHINERTGLIENVPDGALGMQPLVIEENNQDIEALWTYVDLSLAWNFMQEQTGEDPGELTAFWSSNSVVGPKYDPATREIHLRGDSAGYGDVVIQQAAYALVHNVLGAMPAQWMACTEGPTANVQNMGDAACAFIQGFATFLPLAVYSDPIFESVSTAGLDLDRAKKGSAGWEDGDTVAGRIAGAFWDLYEDDKTNERVLDGTDSYNATFVDIWDVIAQKRPTTMAEWWAGWLDLGKDGCEPLGSLSQNTINYNTDPTIDPTKLTIRLKEDEIKIVDLRTFVSDVECGGDQMIFEMLDAGDREAGVHFMPTHTISITPQANWYGTTQVQMEVSDGAVYLPLNLTVIVESVNDCPTITPPLSDPPSVLWDQPITVDLTGRVTDVETPTGLLTYSVFLQPQNENDITVDQQGQRFTFRRSVTIQEKYTARVLFRIADTEGCTTEAPMILIWDRRPNQPPFIIDERLSKYYVEKQGNTIHVDLDGVAGDDEDDPLDLEWYIINELKNATVFVHPGRQKFDFIPEPNNYLGDQRVDLEVKDTGGLSARATITLTWNLRGPNLPPRILRNKMRAKTAGRNADVCYELRGKATDPDDPDGSLTWWMSGVTKGDFKVFGEGTQRLCLQPDVNRRNFVGCVTTTFIVTDPHNAEDRMDMQTCWKDIRVFFPMSPQQVRLR